MLLSVDFNMNTRNNGVYQEGFYCMKKIHLVAEADSSGFIKKDENIVRNFLINLNDEIMKSLLIKKRENLTIIKKI